MTKDRVKRKLSAILSADVEGYSRLMSEDEVLTVRTLESYRKVMADLIDQFRGRVVDSPGDNLLAEFGSVVGAVQCAVEIHDVLKAKNEELPENRRMLFRIGVNLGDVIEEGDRIYGDGVNIAARLESLAEAGGVCISGSAYEQIKNKLALGYEYIGEHSVKNIAEPLKVYRVPMGPKAVTPKEVKEKRAKVKRWQWATLCAVVILILVVGALAIWNFYLRRPSVEPASVERMAYPLPDKPSIAVLPFANISDDPEQEYFSDGITEELINALAKLEGLKVISRTSAFYFKGKDTDIRTIGQKLDVGHVLEGSVRKAGNRLRVSAQLIQVADDIHLWSETYDREMQDVFAIQDDISRAVVDSLKVKLLGQKGTPLVTAPTQNMEAYNLWLRGRQFFYLGGKTALECFEKALEIDPQYAPAYADIARCYILAPYLGVGASRDEVYTKAVHSIEKALERDSNLAESHAYLAYIQMVYEWDWKASEQSIKKALALNPGSVDAHTYFATLLYSTGRVDQALAESKKALELDPYSQEANRHYGVSFWYARKYDRCIAQMNHTLELFPKYVFARLPLASSYLCQGMFDEAITEYKRGLSDFPGNRIILGNLAFAYGMAGKKEEARKILDKMLEASKTGYVPSTPIAKIYASLGNMDKAFEYLEKAYTTREVSGFHMLKVMPDFDIMRSDPRFDALLEKMGLTGQASTPNGDIVDDKKSKQYGPSEKDERYY